MNMHIKLMNTLVNWLIVGVVVRERNINSVPGKHCITWTLNLTITPTVTLTLTLTHCFCKITSIRWWFSSSRCAPVNHVFIYCTQKSRPVMHHT